MTHKTTTSTQTLYVLLPGASFLMEMAVTKG